MKIPRDCNGTDLARAMRALGYSVVRQSGSHMILATQTCGEHHVTVPNHRPIKTGTLSDILKSIARHHELTVEQVVQKLNL